MTTRSIGVAGLLFLAFTSTVSPWFALPGIVLVGTGGQSLLLSDYIQIPVSLQRGSSIYIGLMNGCYDSSVLTFMLVKKLFEEGVDKKYSFIGFAILLILISGVCTLLTSLNSYHWLMLKSQSMFCLAINNFVAFNSDIREKAKYQRFDTRLCNEKERFGNGELGVYAYADAASH
ncbi:uncharacterized protein LOC117321017 [Pecten maximus]|uniref:uncharacterized protein LOC117321017 n=1 Tax=Pecten maximus TaxID=6579 RepID=UPI001458485A|nr:uncharacterized protein LOC117321017 [Pecten maximus]